MVAMPVRAQGDAVGATSSASAACACADAAAASAAVAVSADAIATLRVALRAVSALSLDLATATAGLRVADELRAVFQRSVDAVAASVRGPYVNLTSLDTVHLRLLDLPPDVLLMVFVQLDSRSLLRIAATCSMLYRDYPPRPMTLVEEVLRTRAVMRGHTSPVRLPEGAASWVSHLAWLERRRDEAWAPVAAYTSSSFFVAEGGRLMSCGTEDDVYDNQERVAAGVLGHGALDFAEFSVSTPMLLSSMAGIRINCVSAGEGFSAVVSAAGHVYTWGEGEAGKLGHGDEESRLIPKQVYALVGHKIRCVTTSCSHCLAVTERSEVFSWGWNNLGQCGHGRLDSDHNQLLPRRAEALVGVRARSASAGTHHSLVVTEDGALYSFGGNDYGQLGRGYFNERDDPVIVDALRHVRVIATAVGLYHSIALTTDGVVFSWGYAGPLGRGRVGEDVALLQEVALPHDACLPQKVGALSGLNVCAVVAAMSASFAVTTTGELFTWGEGQSGRLGHGDKSDQLAPKRVEGLRDEWVIAVTCGNRHAMAVVRNGGVFGWGYVKGLGLPEAAAASPDDGDCVFSPVRYQQLSCIP